MTLSPIAERFAVELSLPAVTTCFYDLGLSRPVIEPRSPAHEAYALLLRNRGCIERCVLFTKQLIKFFFMSVLAGTARGFVFENL